ncbi:MAG TPA: ankyrin repeat domain-containing protein, partial [Haloferula sp.]
DDRIAGMGPLHLAAALGDSDAILALLKLGALPNQLAAGASPLIEAASNGHAKAIEVLLAHGADPSLRDADDERAIDQAVFLGHADVARILLHREKPFVENESELLAALVRHSDAELLREFLKAGASIPRDAKVQEDSIFDGRKSDPSAPLKAAVCEPDSGMLRVLMEFPDATGVSVPGFLVLALHQAAECGRLANVRFLIEEKHVDQDVLLDDSLGGVIRIDGDSKEGTPKPVSGYSALSRALEEGHFDIVRYLVDRGAAITGRTRGGEPPLSFAARHSQLEMLRLFLEHKALTELVDIDGETALHSAARSNDATAVKLLLEQGAHAGAKSKGGFTPLDLARTLGAKDVIPLLEKPAK